jgi:hypothetical protein
MGVSSAKNELAFYGKSGPFGLADQASRQGYFMLKQLGALRGIFGHHDQHPLQNSRELARVLAELPSEQPYKALDEIVGWLESMQGADGLAADELFEIVSQLDDAAQPFAKRLSSDYLHSVRQTRSEEKRLWAISHGFHQLQAEVYERCLQAVIEKSKVGERLKSALPLIAARLVAALGAVLKWQQFHYAASPGAVWQRLGQALAVVQRAGVEGKSIVLYPNLTGSSSVLQEFIKVVAFRAASLDSLLPLEIEVAERLISHFVQGFVFTTRAEVDSVYWLDLNLPQAPMRLARMPAAAADSQCFFKPAGGHAQIESLLRQLKQDGKVPAEINLGAPYAPRLLMPVLHHLAAYLAPIPPQRAHTRYPVKHRMAVVHGVFNSFMVFSAKPGDLPTSFPIESWVVENVSRGGFQAVIESLPVEWLKVGALIAMQPEGGKNWLLGVVRRYSCEESAIARVGIKVLAHQVSTLELKPQTISSFASLDRISGLSLGDVSSEELTLVLPPASFDSRENLQATLDGVQRLLQPVALVEQTLDYEIARYRLRALD